MHSDRFHELYLSRLGGYRNINVRASIPTDDGEYLSQNLRKRIALHPTYLVNSTDVIEGNLNHDEYLRN